MKDSNIWFIFWFFLLSYLWLTCRQHDQTTRTRQERPPQTTLRAWVHNWKMWKSTTLFLNMYVHDILYVHMYVCKCVYSFLFLYNIAHTWYVGMYVCMSCMNIFILYLIVLYYYLFTNIPNPTSILKYWTRFLLYFFFEMSQHEIVVFLLNSEKTQQKNYLHPQILYYFFFCTKLKSMSTLAVKTHKSTLFVHIHQNLFSINGINDSHLNAFMQYSNVHI